MRRPFVTSLLASILSLLVAVAVLFPSIVTGQDQETVIPLAARLHDEASRLGILLTVSAAADDDHRMSASQAVLMMQNPDDDLNLSYYAQGVMDTAIGTIVSCSTKAGCGSPARR
jgi:hypothetical protein